MTGYDIIGDVHGCAEELEDLLDNLDYVEVNGVYQHKDGERSVIFVGDLIDRGPGQVRVLELVRRMVEAGSAQIVLGNHEFNAIGFATPNPEEPGEFMRRHTKENVKQHQAFLTQLDSEQRYDYLEWFRTLPMWLELEDGLRVVHACWHQESIDFIRQRRLPDERLSDEFIVEANTKKSRLYEACETVLKGPECSLTDSGLPKFLDKGDHPRANARIRWWKTDAVDLRDLAEIPDDSLAESRDPYPFHLLDGLEPPDGALDFQYGTEEPLVIFGHYWNKGELAKMSPNTVCVDYSAVTDDGVLVAYKWDHETKGEPEHFVSHSAGKQPQSLTVSN